MKKIPISLLILLFALSSCKQEEVRSYKEPKKNNEAFRFESKAQASPHANAPFMNMNKNTAKAQAMLAGIVKLADKTAFVKMSGGKQDVKSQMSIFFNFIKLSQFSTEPVQLSVPPTWEQVQKESSFRFASFTAKDTNLDISISFLPGNGGGDLGNINRWRGQLGLPNINESQLEEISRVFPLGPKKVRITHLERPGHSHDHSAHKPVEQKQEEAKEDDCANCEHHAPKKEAVKTPIKKTAVFEHQAPQSWQSLPTSSMRKLAYAIPAKEGKIEITVFKFGKMSTLSDNLNRWRGQVGLKNLSAEANDKSAQKITLDGKEAKIVEALGAQTSILAAIIPDGNFLWYIKATGPTKAVAANRNDFITFLKTIKF